VSAIMGICLSITDFGQSNRMCKIPAVSYSYWVSVGGGCSLTALTYSMRSAQIASAIPPPHQWGKVSRVGVMKSARLG